MPENTYIHIPFCRSKCRYCSFTSGTDLGLKNDYLEALEKEIKFHYQGEPLKTLYFGGGTPSLLTVEEIEKLIWMFNFDNAEITLELNPEGLSQEYFEGLKKIGVNRLSFGSQTFDEELLKVIGRRHSAEDVVTAVNLAQSAGFDNISLDFIYGLPGQTIEGFAQDLEKAISFGVQHISLYGLKIEQGCYFYDNPSVCSSLPDEDAQADMYLKAIEILTANGFEHYEISNFSRPGFASAHNLNYWNNNSYYGFGCSAHGYIIETRDEKLGISGFDRRFTTHDSQFTKNDYSVRYSNSCELERYIQGSTASAEEKILTLQEQLEEEIFLGLRKSEGINIKKINQRYDIDFQSKYRDILSIYQDFGHIKTTPNGYCLTPSGMLISSVILSEFLD